MSNNIFSEPDPSVLYACSPTSMSTGFTKLMKWVLLTKANCDLIINIKVLIEENPSVLDKQNDGGWTALMLACANIETLCSEPIVQLLIDAGANPNLRNE